MGSNFSEMIFLFFLALIIFGPKKLPEIGRQIGKVLNEFKKASNEFKAQIESEIHQLDLAEQRKVLPQVLPPFPAQPPPGAIAAAPALPETSVELAKLPEPETALDKAPHA